MELQVLYTSGAHYVEPNWRSIDRTLCFYFFVCEKLGKKWTMWLDYAYWVIFFLSLCIEVWTPAESTWKTRSTGRTERRYMEGPTFAPLRIKCD